MPSNSVPSNSVPPLALPAGVSVRQQHFDNGSVALGVDALLLPPPLQAKQAQQASASAAVSTGDSSAPGQVGQAERGTLLLQLTSPDGSQRWQAKVDVTSLPADAAPAATTCNDVAGGTWRQPWTPLDAAGLAAAGRGERGGAPPVPPPARHSVRIVLDSPQLWWPHDLGDQPLYSLQLTYVVASDHQGSATAAEGPPPAAEDGPHSSSGSSQALVRRVGLRRVELVTQPLGGDGAPPGAASLGETFFVRINGQPLYARGVVSCSSAPRSTDWHYPTLPCTLPLALRVLLAHSWPGGTCAGSPPAGPYAT